MIRKYDTNERRILNFPAVWPCESISPAILLNSLIDLCHDISKFRRKTQNKISREIFRQVDILLIFFLEIQENCTKFRNSLVLCLSELHFALQKFRFLVQDFTREGSRLYVLIHSEVIANQFRDLVRSIGFSLEIVRQKPLEISNEVKELVELLSKQARKSSFESDPNDEWAVERVRFIVMQFERGLEPERVSVKWVLDYLGIKSWVECNNEVVFLENVVNNVVDEERDVTFLSSLLGFMCYCRGVLYDKLDEMNGDDVYVISRNETGLVGVLNPEDFRCPISLELMTDPVTISTGHTYDRASIAKWLNAGRLLCPKTGEKLKTTEFVPNSALKNLMHKFCAENGISLLISKSSKKSAGVECSVACKEAVRMLAQFLAGRLRYGTDEQKNKAAYEVRLLSKSSAFNRVTLIEFGNVAPLLDLLTSEEASAQENAIAALLKLAKHTRGQKAIIEEGGLMLIIMVLRHGLKVESRQIAAATIFYLSSVEKYRKLIGSTREAITGLIDLIMDGTVTGKKNAMAAIYGLLLYHGNHTIALDAGIVQQLLSLVTTSPPRSDISADALAILATLADRTEGCIEILMVPALKTILRLVKSPISRAGKECCVSILLSLCRYGETQVVAEVAREPGIMPTLYSVVTDGSSHGNKKARALISLLHQHQESSTSSLLSSLAFKKREPQR